VNLNVSGKVDASKLTEFLGAEEQMALTGNVDLQSNIKGPLPHWKFDPKKTQLSGNIKWQNGSFLWKPTNHHLEQIQLQAQLNGSDIQVQELYTHIGDSDVSLTGTLKEFMGFVNGDQDLVVDVHSNSQNINVEDFLISGNNDGAVVSSEQVGSSMMEHIKIKGDVIINHLNYHSFSASELSGSIDWANQNISLANVTGNCASGSIKTDVSLQKKGAGYQLTADLNHQGIFINEFFDLFDNFGQEFITSQHLRGASNGESNVQFDLSPEFKIEPNSIIAIAKININNGELIALESMDEMCVYLKENGLISTFVDADELQKTLHHVYFEELQNEVRIEKGMISIPKMLIASSAMDITIEGSHSFKQNIDYSVGLYLRDLYKKKQSEYGIIEDDGAGNRFFLRMSGNLEDPQFGYDRLAHKEHRKEIRQQEKQTLKTIIKEDLNPFKKKPDRDEPVSSSPESSSTTVEISVGEEEENEKDGKGIRGLFKRKNKKEKPIEDTEDDDF
ncbi:MAG: AsmA-like C-terminal region-containing protein, partial [Bacteroidota bacterium]